jgi:hypothetical protein
LSDQWKESIIVSIYRKCDETDCSNYHEISLLSISYKILSNTLSRLSPYTDELLGIMYKCNGSITNQIFCTRQILEKKWEYNKTVHQLFIGFRQAYDSVRREVLYNILLEFGVPLKLVRLIKMWLNETHSKIRIGKVCPIVFLSKMI